MCKYMKDNSLENILRALKKPDLDDIIQLDDKTRHAAQKCIDAMFYYNDK